MTSIINKLVGTYIVILISTLVCEARLIRSNQNFVETKGTEFVLNGSPFLFNGFNSYWMMNVASDPNERYRVSNVFRDASASGLTICRTWAFSDGGNQSLQISPGIYNEIMFQALDFVISEAKKNGVRLILSLVNNYKDFGGRPQYVQWANSSGVPVNNDDDFYTNPVIKGYYKNHVKMVLTRMNTITKMAYKDEPTIMAWELINEPRTQLDYSSNNTLNAWIKEMGSYVKSIDKKHLLEVGLEGFYGDSNPDRIQYNPGFQVGTDFLTNNLVKQIDFATIHAYPDNWLAGQNDTVQMAFMERWITSHWNDSRTILKKPLVFTEFGMSKSDSGYSIEAWDSFMNSVYSSIYSLAQNGGTFAGGLVWQVFDEGMDSYDDGYEIVLNQNSSTTSVISQQSYKMIALEHTLSIKH